MDDILLRRPSITMSESKPEPPARSSGRSPDPPPSAAARYRLQQRQSSDLNASKSPQPGIDRRRSSVLSFSSLDEVTQSLTDDLINPSMTKARNVREEDEVTHWHSTPLAFAILPALGGLLFKNGSAFITDILLLSLAAIFMNWSIRLPWDWYYSAQAQQRDSEADFGLLPVDLEADETAVESASSAGESPKQSPQRSPESASRPAELVVEKREEAAAELRRQEKLALFSTFVFPALAALLLHVIRAQLSRPSTSLVSDYNLSIFLLAAEVRPCRQLVRLMTNRTLYLQRTVTGLDEPFGSAIKEKSVISSLTSRLSELEAKLSDHAIVPANVSIAQKTDVSELSAEMKKRYEPRLEGLERAVRRYEKRSTTLAMLTDQRLGSLETRLQDALSLAAVAAQQSQSRGVTATLLESVSALISLPLKVAWTLAVWPLHVLGEVYTKLRGMLFGSAPARPRKPSSSRHGAAKEERAKDKGSVWKSVR